jgi:citronellyl-CoA dehydrogenase
LPDLLTRPAQADPAGILDEVPADAPLRAVWAALGASGALAGLYHRQGRGLTIIPGQLRGLLGALDQRGRNGVTLGACVQLAMAIPLLAGGTTAPAEAALSAAVSGEAVTALAATDEGAGSDLSGLGTEADIGADELTLSGRKRWITNAGACDQILVLARHRPGRHFTSFSWVLVPRSAPGVRISPSSARLFDGAALGDIEFSGVRLPVSHLVGPPWGAMPLFAQHITRERLAGAIWAAALCRRALRAVHAAIGRRDYKGQPLWSLDPLRHRLASAIVEVRMLEGLTRELERRITDGYDPAAAALLKAAAAHVAARVLDQCASLEGAAGYLPGHAQDLRAEAAVFGIGGGTTDLMLATIADHADALLAADQP